jgi:glycosyltransferase involved in cell wall biosynthesis
VDWPAETPAGSGALVMTIVLVSPHYPPRFIGGVEHYTRRLAQRLRVAGHDVRVVAVERLDADHAEAVQVDETSDDGVPVSRLSLRRVDARGAATYTYDHPDIRAWFHGWLVRERPAVIHLQSGYLLGGAVLRAAAARQVPVIVTLHDFWFICPRITLLHPDQTCCAGPETPAGCAWCMATEQRRYRLPARLVGNRMVSHAGPRLAASPLARLAGLRVRVQDADARRAALLPALATAAAILSPSRFVRDQLVRAGFDGDRITLLPYGIEPRAPVLRRDADGVRLRLGFLGQIAPHKGLHVLIDAVRALPDASIELIIHGDLTREPAYVRALRASAAGDPRIIFAGPLGQADLDRLFQQIDALAVPSVWYENSPFVIHEARRAGLPVLASRLGGMAELIRHDEDGLLAEAGDAAAFARQLDRMIREPDLLTRLRGGVTPPPAIGDEVRALLRLYERAAAPVLTAAAAQESV